MRLDVALHALRVFKSRTQAGEAIDQGRVLVAGRSAKAGLAVRAGDRITLVGPRGRRTFELLELPARSLTKDAAKALVRDLPPESASGDA